MAFYSKLNNASLDLRRVEQYIQKIPKPRQVIKMRKISLQENLSELRKSEVIPRTMKKRVSLKILQDQIKTPSSYTDRRSRCQTIGLIPQLMFNSTSVQKQKNVPKTNQGSRRSSQCHSNITSDRNILISVQKSLTERKQRITVFSKLELEKIHKQENLNLQKIQIRRLFQQFYQRVDQTNKLFRKSNTRHKNKLLELSSFDMKFKQLEWDLVNKPI